MKIQLGVASARSRYSNRAVILIDRVRKLKNRYLQIDLQTIVMCRGRSNQENTRVAANFVHLF